MDQVLCLVEHAFKGDIEEILVSQMQYSDMIGHQIAQVLPEWEAKSDLSFLGCPSSRCQLTANRTLLPNVEMFDAIVFHQFNFDWEDLPSAR